MNMQKINKALMLGGVAAVTLGSALEASAVQCDALAVIKSPSACTIAVGQGAGNFIVTPITVRLSANVVMAHEGDDTAAAFKAASAKGMHTFGGTTNGGAVMACQVASIANPHAGAAMALTTGGLPIAVTDAVGNVASGGGCF